jgi:hypothetical protein
MLPIEMKVFKEDGADGESQQHGRADPTHISTVSRFLRFAR